MQDESYSVEASEPRRPVQSQAHTQTTPLPLLGPRAMRFSCSRNFPRIHRVCTVVYKNRSSKNCLFVVTEGSTGPTVSVSGQVVQIDRFTRTHTIHSRMYVRMDQLVPTG